MAGRAGHFKVGSARSNRHRDRLPAGNAVELARRFLARGLYEVDQVAAGVFKQDGGNRTHSLWLAAEVDPKSFESLELCANVFRHEHSGRNSCGKQRFLIRLCRRKTRGLKK